MELSMEREYRLRWMDFDRYGRMQPSAIFDIFQDVATMQAMEMGIGGDDMRRKGVFWAVVRSKYEVLRDPAHFQVVIARTWPHTPSRFSFLRDYSLYDVSGELLVKCTSEWVLMDIETRKFASVMDYYDGSTDFDESRNFESKPRKIARFDEENLPVHTVVPGCSDIDLNGHVNNARYLDYVMDALNLGPDEAVRTLQLDYRHEVLPGSPIHMHSLLKDGRALVKGVNEQGETAFACAIELR